MNALGFLHSPAAVRTIDRAARAAGTPVSVHFVRRSADDKHGEEGARVAGAGQCAACEMVAGLPGGVWGCRDSRLSAAMRALRRGRPCPFLCHMGFACFAIPVLEGEGFVMTFGPYCPPDGSESLEHDAKMGLKELGIDSDPDWPTLLDDVRLAPASSILAVAEWAAECLEERWQASREDTTAAEDAEGEETPRARGRRRTEGAGTSSPTVQREAAAIAAALAGGNLKLARSLTDSALADAHPKGKLAARRARAVGLAASILEAAERAGARTKGGWNCLPQAIEEVKGARTDAQMGTALGGLLSSLRRKGSRAVRNAEAFTELNRLVLERIPGPVTLAEVARQLGEHPTTLTHRLQRKFEMSFSEYVGRLRVARAKELLRRTKLGVKEVGKRIGVADPSNFGKLFRKHEGISPREYRSRFAAKEKPGGRGTRSRG